MSRHQQRTEARAPGFDTAANRGKVLSSTTLLADIEFYSGLFGPSGHEDLVIRPFVDAVQAMGYPA